MNDKFGPGVETWEQQLSDVSDDVREKLVEKIEKVQAMVQGVTA